MTETVDQDMLDSLDQAWIDFDADLLAVDTSQFAASMDALIEKYPVFAELYFRQVVRLAPPTDSLQIDPRRLSQFLHSPLSTMLRSKRDSVFADLSPWKRDMAVAMVRFAKLFPGRDIPDIYLLNSEFGYYPFVWQDAEGRDALGISLEMFLGEAFPYESLAVQSPVFSQYNLISLQADYMVKKSMDVLIDDALDYPLDNRLIDLMIHQGKKIYLLSKIFPDRPESYWMEYTEEQMKWCEQNEEEIWRFLIGEDLLYTAKGTHKYTEPAASSPGMPPSAPGRVANWIGFRIVKAYMDAYGDLDRLLSHKDAQQLLREAKYKPSR